MISQQQVDFHEPDITKGRNVSVIPTIADDISFQCCEASYAHPLLREFKCRKCMEKSRNRLSYAFSFLGTTSRHRGGAKVHSLICGGSFPRSNPRTYDKVCAHAADNGRGGTSHRETNEPNGYILRRSIVSEMTQRGARAQLLTTTSEVSKGRSST